MNQHQLLHRFFNFCTLTLVFIAWDRALPAQDVAVAASDIQASQRLLIRAERIVTLAGKDIQNGAILIVNGKIKAIGSADEITADENTHIIEGKIAVPGLVDVRSTLGLSGILNYDADQDQLESSSPLQPELRASDAFNAKEALIPWVRGFGITTVNTGHGPGELISGQTALFKLTGGTVESSLIRDHVAVAATLATEAQKTGKSSPGTRGKMLAMLRELFIETEEYASKMEKSNQDPDADLPTRNLRLETMLRVLRGKQPLLITADRAQDIASAIRISKEFNVKIWLDSAAEAYLMLDEIKAAGMPVLLHPSMARSSGEKENASFNTPAKLRDAGIPFAIQSGYEPYVPKARVILFEAALAAANGLTFEEALNSITLAPAKILGIDDRVGSLEVGKDGDIAIYDGDPFEYTTHCTGVIIDGHLYPGESHQ
jgi:imidazolonepropionase-like amidohydrolase